MQKTGYRRHGAHPVTPRRGFLVVVTEYYDRVSEPNGDLHLVITTRVEDPAYLAQPFLASSHFQKQADAAGWNPTPCLAK